MEAAGGKLDLNDTDNSSLVDSFCEITSSTRQEAAFYLESHQWDLDSAVSTFLDNDNASAAVVAAADSSAAASAGVAVRPSRAAVDTPSPTDSPGESQSPDYSPSQSPSRSRSRSSSPAPAKVSRVSSLPYRLRSRGADEDNKKNKKPRTDDGGGSTSKSRNRSGITTLADLNRASGGSDSDDEDDDEPQEYYTGGQKSGMLVQDPKKKFDADAIFDQARNSGAVQRPEDSSRASAASSSFAGTGRLLSGETVPASSQPAEFVNHTIMLWRNGFTVNDGPLRRLNDPANAEFLESIKKSECPTELAPEDSRTKVHLNLVRRDENYTKQEPPKKKAAFKGVGRTLTDSSDGASASEPRTAPPLSTAPLPSSGLTVDSSAPTTSIQLRLADGTRMVSRFNLHHTVRDVRGFIMASRPGEAQDFQLQTMGFPPKQLTDPDQTIQDAGIANSVVIQKL
ncbi:Plant UBX domain-containing protein 5 [Linum grandiflorum]